MAVGNSRAGGDGSGVGGKADLRVSGSRSIPLDMYAGLGDGDPSTSTDLDGLGELLIGSAGQSADFASNEGGKSGAGTTIMFAYTICTDHGRGVKETASKLATYPTCREAFAILSPDVC